MWFVPKAVNKAEIGAPLYDMGRCRRHAPAMGGYPVVFVNDWCGDHRLDENKFYQESRNECQKAQTAKMGQWNEVLPEGYANNSIRREG